MPPFSGRHRSMTPWVGCRSPSASMVGRVKQDSSSLGSAAQRLTLSRYVARLKPRCGSLALSVMWYVLTVSQVGAWLDLSEISYPSISTANTLHGWSVCATLLV